MLKRVGRTILKTARFSQPSRAMVALVLATNLITAGCGSSSVSDKSRALAQSFEQTSLQDGHPPPALSSENLRARIYLDASLSMSGYVTGKPDDQTEFDMFVDKLGDYLPGCRVYKFGQGDTQELLSPANFDRSVHTPAFYSLNYNPNDALIREINTQEEFALSVIVTDGVQSDDPGQGNPPVVEAIVEWLNKGGVFGIFMLKSRFKGPFYSEHARTWIRNQDGLSTFYIGARPFYAFVLSPTQHEFNELRSKILRDFPETGVVLIGGNSVTCEVTEASGGPTPYGRGSPQWRWFRNPFGRSAAVQLDHQVECQINPDYTATRLTLTPQVTTCPWDGSDFNRVETAAATGSEFFYEQGDTTGSSSATQDFRLRLTLVRDARSNVTFYRIRSRANISDLRPDIRDRNTEDDSDPRNVEKTYRLSSLVIALTEAHLKGFVREQSLPRFYLTVENK